jgi:putative AbiEi antitoxin of type IV toxin-antitoxin system
MKVWTGMSHLHAFSSVSTKPSAQIPASLPPVFTYSDAVGLSAERLYRYRNEGHLEQLGPGLSTG